MTRGSHPPATTFNPTFELAYWAFGLETAQRWRERLGMAILLNVSQHASSTHVVTTALPTADA